MGISIHNIVTSGRRAIKILQRFFAETRTHIATESHHLKGRLQEQLAGHRQVHRNDQNRSHEAHLCQRRNDQIDEKHLLPLLAGHFLGPGLANRKLHSFRSVHDLRLQHDNLQPRGRFAEENQHELIKGEEDGGPDLIPAGEAEGVLQR
jgi:hypothetical protein